VCSTWLGRGPRSCRSNEDQPQRHRETRPSSGAAREEPGIAIVASAPRHPLAFGVPSSLPSMSPPDRGTRKLGHGLWHVSVERLDDVTKPNLLTATLEVSSFDRRRQDGRSAAGRASDGDGDGGRRRATAGVTTGDRRCEPYRNILPSSTASKNASESTLPGGAREPRSR